MKLSRETDQTLTIVVQALQRIRIDRIIQETPFFRAEIQLLRSHTAPVDDPNWQATLRHFREVASRLLKHSPDAPPNGEALLEKIEDPGRLSDFFAANLPLDTLEKQQLLEELDVARRIEVVQKRLSSQLEISELQQKIDNDVASQFSDAQRRAYLREQVRAIQRELGEAAGADDELELLRRRLQESKPPDSIVQQAERELNRLKLIPPSSPEFSIIVSYVQALAELPWSVLSTDNMDLDQARMILDRDHYDLEKVKRRLIEYLAVRKLNPSGRGPILCFLGPPGVGKTSLGQSIADALGRKFSRLSLGGIRDESEIRGHRRTYIGSMPGRIIQELRRLKTRNPVMMLDEVDKIGADFRGDPASALLEVLDPRQNNAFTDRYIDAPFDLSQIIFIATANYIDAVPPALRDRMEVLEIPGYTETEKLQISLRYLVPRQLQENGISAEHCEFKAEALSRIIEDYTHEAGVRELERQIGNVYRAVAARIASGSTDKTWVTPDNIAEFLGPARYVRESRLKTSKPGVVTGLAYTPLGGEVLHIEALRYPGKGRLILTGHIGEVMKESVQAAMSLVRSRAAELRIEAEDFRNFDLHLHVPSGAVPKDGPSAGVAMFTAIASLFSDIPVRSDVAMTGEISLRGLVLAIGGLKEKTLAAMRAGLATVVIPALNQKDVPELPAEVKEKLKFVFAETVDDVLHSALQSRDEASTSGTETWTRAKAA